MVNKKEFGNGGKIIYLKPKQAKRMNFKRKKICRMHTHMHTHTHKAVRYYVVKILLFDIWGLQWKPTKRYKSQNPPEMNDQKCHTYTFNTQPFPFLTFSKCLPQALMPNNAEIHFYRKEKERENKIIGNAHDTTAQSTHTQRKRKKERWEGGYFLRSAWKSLNSSIFKNPLLSWETRHQKEKEREKKKKHTLSKNRKYCTHMAIVAFSSAVKSNFFTLSADFHHFDKEKSECKSREIKQ